MINTLNDFKLLESEELKNSIAEFLFKLYCKLPEQFKESALPATENDDFVEVVIPTRRQVMMEDLVDLLEKKVGLHILYASKMKFGKHLRAVAYSTPVEGSMFIVHLGSEQYGILDSMTVHFFDSEEIMLLSIHRLLRDNTHVEAEVLECQKMNQILSHFF